MNKCVYFLGIFVSLMLIGLLGFSSMSVAEEGKWTKKADMPTPRAGLSTCVVNGKIYAIGGWEASTIVEEYDPLTDIWTKKANVPTTREAFSASAVNGKIYVIGGIAKGGTLSMVEAYDPVTDKWTKRADMPTSRAWLSTSVVNGKIYAIGGEKIEGGWGSNVRTVEAYDPVTNQWTKKADMQIQRAGLSTSVVDGKIYAIGGGWVLMEAYDPATNTWTPEEEILPAQWTGFSTSAVGRKVYVIGGWDGQGAPFSRVRAYDPSTDTWTPKRNMPTARWLLSTSVVSGKIYAIGGSPKWPETLSTVEEYDPGLAVEAKGKLVTGWGKIKFNGNF